ncbi:uncharacterized protein MAM_06942 [Metarhizium album ARSEF 1941]|uniref:Uncharacterized protein n=1 Tax=Metarhizium album (strain ARSEF 1941) TaxID=1081103 RepID=A0A0B2WGV3_METAS|nr:uncharacterized protein MAM_06942 [Metarhizium album ARSEF 1941]KHN95231.1 hypothetical protein MAM_06942 [Metarhizium album ARSEF 1941]
MDSSRLSSDSLEGDGHLGASSLGLSNTNPVRNGFNSGGYERLNVDGDGGDDDVTSPERGHAHVSPESTTNSLGVFPGRLTGGSAAFDAPGASEVTSLDSTSHLLDSSRGPETPDGTSAKPTASSRPGLHRIIRKRVWPWSRRSAAASSPSPAPGAADDGSTQAPSDRDPEQGDDGVDEETFRKIYSEPPTYCSSRENPSRKRNKVITAVAIYALVMSGTWLVLACKKQRWGYLVSSTGKLTPATATTLATGIAKSIELSSVAAFTWCVGQELTRRAYRKSRGLTLAEIGMRDWVKEPGAWFQNWDRLRVGGRTVWTPLTCVMILATVGATLYTAASDAMVSPKLRFDKWTPRVLRGPVATSYGNVKYAKRECPSMFGGTAGAADPSADDACINVEFSGQSYRNLLAYMETWTARFDNATQGTRELAARPAGTSLLRNNVTLEGAWIETQHSNITASYLKYGRIVNNVTMALPHPGVYAAATSPVNRIMQPDALSGIGQYSIRAGVVSPAINVMCVGASRDELAPLVYTTWPGSKSVRSGIGHQEIPVEEKLWVNDVPSRTAADGKPYYYNSTVLDDIFLWGPEHSRYPPVFSTGRPEQYPYDYNFISNSTVFDSTGIYTIAKHPDMVNYTICEARSWVSPACSTHFDVSGTAGWKMKAHCEDKGDGDAYHHSDDKKEWALPSRDWKHVGTSWQLSMDMNGGQRNSNASNSRILTKTALRTPDLVPYQPSLAEVFAVYLGSTLVISAIDTPYKHWWAYDITDNILQVKTLEGFNATVRSQEYTSGYSQTWQAVVWFPVLGLVVGLNLLSFSYMVCHKHTITDFTETENLFALAINSPPSSQFKGSCGGGPKKRNFVVPWKVAYAPTANHYFFQEASDMPFKGRYSKAGRKAGGDVVEKELDAYRRLSKNRMWS